MQQRKERWKGVGNIKMEMKRTMKKEEKAGREVEGVNIDHVQK